jgi:hypothetical protein
MPSYLEAVVSLLPADAGGPRHTIAPRDGSYRPFARACESRLRIRFIEGPPLLAPGQAARVVVEVESGGEAIASGAELDLLEHASAPVGILTVLRVMREEVAL